MLYSNGIVPQKPHGKAAKIFALLPDEYKVVDTALLTSTAKKNKDTKPVPGIEFYFEPGLQVRSR